MKEGWPHYIDIHDFEALFAAGVVDSPGHYCFWFLEKDLFNRKYKNRFISDRKKSEIMTEINLLAKEQDEPINHPGREITL